jgi:hypothetical protein
VEECERLRGVFEGARRVSSLIFFFFFPGLDRCIARTLTGISILFCFCFCFLTTVVIIHSLDTKLISATYLNIVYSFQIQLEPKLPQNQRMATICKLSR